MATINTSFEVNCTDNSPTIVDFYTTPFHFLTTFTPFDHTDIILELSVVTCTLGSGNELGLFQRFVAQSQDIVSTIPRGDFNKINYPTNSLTHQYEVNVIVQELYNYLSSLLCDRHIYIIIIYPQLAEHLKQLFTIAGYQFPEIIKFIRLDSLLRTTLKFFGQQPLKDFLTVVEKANTNIPGQNLCPYHAQSSSGSSYRICITKTIRKHWYTLHAILKQCGLNVEGDYIPLTFRRKTPNYKPKVKEQKAKQSEFTSQPITQPIKQSTKQPRTKKVMTNILTPEFKNIFNEYFPNFHVHFIDFEMSNVNGHLVPVEVGISTFDLISNNEANWCQAFINPGKYKNKMNYTTKAHGIDPTTTSIPFKSIEEVRNGLLIYFNQYQGLKFVCVKDEDIVGKNYKCLNQILVTIPNDICIITHIELFEMICKHYNVPLPQEHSSILSSTHKQLDTCQRCSFHETIEKHYHCGLGDSRTTALMIIVEMNNLGISIENAEQLPTVKRISTTFSINKNNFLFINNSKYSGCKKYI